MVEIDEDKWGDRFAYGIVSSILLMGIILLLGTRFGRALLVFAVILISIIFTLGITTEVAIEAYEEYVE